MQPDIHLGTHAGSDDRQVFLPIDDTRRHVLISGRSGTGKSVLLANIFSQLADLGHGALLIDPHGSLANLALDLVPRSRINKTIHIKPSDMAFPVGFNLLADVEPDKRAVRTAELVGAFHNAWGDQWGPQLHDILYHTIRSLLDMPGATLLGIEQMLRDVNYRDRVIAQVQDPAVRNWWRTDFTAYQNRREDPSTSVLNKVRPFLASPAIRNMLGNPKSAFSLCHIIEKRYLVIVNLAKGALGDDHANLFGSLLIASLWSAAQARDTGNEALPDFTLIVDEFPNYTTRAFETMLAEARKFRLSLLLSHQHLGQLPERTRDAVLGNAGSLILFRAAHQDAPIFAREFVPYESEHLTNAANGEAWCKLLQHGMPTEPFRMRTLPPPRVYGHADKIINNSRVHFATARESIEARINRFLSSSHDDCRAKPKHFDKSQPRPQRPVLLRRRDPPTRSHPAPKITRMDEPARNYTPLEHF